MQFLGSRVWAWRAKWKEPVAPSELVEATENRSQPQRTRWTLLPLREVSKDGQLEPEALVTVNVARYRASGLELHGGDVVAEWRLCCPDTCSSALALRVGRLQRELKSRPYHARVARPPEHSESATVCHRHRPTREPEQPSLQPDIWRCWQNASLVNRRIWVRLSLNHLTLLHAIHHQKLPTGNALLSRLEAPESSLLDDLCFPPQLWLLPAEFSSDGARRVYADAIQDPPIIPHHQIECVSRDYGQELWLRPFCLPLVSRIVQG